MKKLLIVESPAKIKTISKFLGKDFKIMSTVGHIMDLPPKRLGVTMNGSIDLEYEIIEGKEKVIADICKEASKCDEIFLAPDPDREGEIIAWHVEQQIEKVIKDHSIIHRISFNEITKPAVQEAITHQADVDLDKVSAQQARRVLDRWVGYEVSPILWQKIAPGLSAGRVQSVALRLICDREEAIRAFKPEEYWTIHAIFVHEQSPFEAELSHIGKKKPEITNEKQAKEIVSDIKKQKYIVESITDKTRSKQPLPPFMTSTLQQAAFNRLGFGVKKTMQLAQKLYEGIPLEDASTPVALITYMRSDSLRVSDTALKNVRSYLGDNFSRDYMPSKANMYAKKSDKGQDAHEAIRPIDVAFTPEKVAPYLNKDLAKLYELIWRRFVASQMTPAEYAQRQVVVKGGEYTFKVTGSTLLFDGFLKVYAPEEDEKEQKVIIPQNLAENSKLDTQKIDPKQHFTQPPPKYTEASLVKEMEKEGIGRPSTYATILSTIQARSYTTVDTKKRFTPTELGMTVTKLLVEYLPHIMDPKFTAHMEEDLDKIAAGDMARDALLRGFYGHFEKELEALRNMAGKGKKPADPTHIKCPSCKENFLAIRFSRNGEFLGCLNYPECTFTSPFIRNEQGELELAQQEQPAMLEQKCPLCGKQLRVARGKYGAFIACSGYPDCKYIHQNKANFPCPNDGGDVVERKWRGGKFWGCNNYPKCKFAVFSDIEQTPCPQCNNPYLLKKTSKAGITTVSCPNKECGYSIKKS